MWECTNTRNLQGRQPARKNHIQLISIVENPTLVELDLHSAIGSFGLMMVSTVLYTVRIHPRSISFGQSTGVAAAIIYVFEVQGVDETGYIAGVC